MPDEPDRRDHPRWPVDPASRIARGRRVDIELRGPLGCLVGSIILALAFCLLVVAGIAGFIAVAVAFWTGAAILALGILGAIVRDLWRSR